MLLWGEARRHAGTVTVGAVSILALVAAWGTAGPVRPSFVDGVDSLAFVTGAGLAAALAWAVGHRLVRRVLEDDRRRVDSAEQLLISATREQREQLHELRSTVAGLVSGSQLLDNPEVSPEVRERLWCSLRRELDRMERLLAGQDEGATDLDLDDALGTILDLQRLKGRHVELRTSGDVVHARYDSLAEVVNVLVDNAAKHGGTDTSVVEVVAHDEESVDITVTDFGSGIPAEQRSKIFEWGGRASAAPGEGIGLHVAQRLMSEDGGSLRLADGQAVGSQFVITLPRARRSPEDSFPARGMEVGHAGR